MKQVTQESLMMAKVGDQFDTHQMEEAKMNSLRFNSNLRGIIGHGGMAHPLGPTPPHSLPPVTPHLGGLAQPPTDETPVDIGEVRDEAMMEIVSGTEGDSIALQGVVDGLSRPRDPQIVKMNELLVKKKKDIDERLDGLARLEANRRASKQK